MSDSKREYTPIQTLVIISLAIFISEAMVMVILYYLSPLKRSIETILDSLFLLIILAPLLYFFLFRSMLYYVDKLKRNEELLRLEGERFYSVVSWSKDAILMMDGNGKVSLWNDASEKMFGYSFDEAAGKELHKLIVPETYREKAGEGLKRFFQTGEGAIIGKTLNISGLRKDGHEFPAELSVSATKIRGEWHAIGIIRDITERKKAEEELKQRMYELERFHNATVHREFRMKELKEENEMLKKRIEEMEKKD